MIALFHIHAEYHSMLLSLIPSLLKNSILPSSPYSTMTSWLIFSCNCCFCFSVLFPGEVSTDVILQLVMDVGFSSDLLNRSSSKFVTMEQNIKTSVSSIPNKEWLVRTFARTLFLEFSFMPLSFPFSRPFYSRCLLHCRFFLAAIKSWVLIMGKA